MEGGERETQSRERRKKAAERGRDRDVKRGQETERVAEFAALTEMSPLHDFPCPDAGHPYLISILLGSCSPGDTKQITSRVPVQHQLRAKTISNASSGSMSFTDTNF